VRRFCAVQRDGGGPAERKQKPPLSGRGELLNSFRQSRFLSLSGCANRGLMAAEKSPWEPGRSETRKAENCGKPSGGTDFLLARPGWDFKPSHQKAAWRDP
jgi:hypothetical protein